MGTVVHFIDVGQGNMTLVRTASGKRILCDCNVTDENENPVLTCLRRALSGNSEIDIFVNSHRDADHMRGVKKVHQSFPIREIWDSGATGSTPDCTEYCDYMDLRRRVGYRVVQAGKYFDYGVTRLLTLNAANSQFAADP